MRKAMLFVVLAALACGASSENAPEKKMRTISLSAPLVRRNQTERLWVATGGARLVTSEGEITAKEVQGKEAGGGGIEWIKAVGNVHLKLTVTDRKNILRKVDAECGEALYESSGRTLTMKAAEPEKVRATVVEPQLQRTTTVKCSSAVLKLETGDYDFLNVEMQITQPEKEEQPASPPKAGAPKAQG
jgi:hypothetical protein